MSCLRILIIVTLCCITGTGCSLTQSQPKSELQPQAFYRPAPGVEEVGNRGDKSGAIVNPEARHDPRVPIAKPLPLPEPAAPEPHVVAADPPTTAPVLAVGSGGYVTVGAVVVVVSNTPIYADKVLRALTPLLSAEAKRRDLQSFTALATDKIQAQVTTEIESQLYYAAAQKQLTAEDKQRVEMLTMAWRQRQITEAGGSEEEARRKARTEGIDFDEKVREYNRGLLFQFLVFKKVENKAEVTAEDIRRYYDQHLAEFTDVAQAQFRVIKISAKNMGEGAQGRDLAIEKIRQLREQATHSTDEEFAKLASSINHDPGLMKSGGRIGASDGWVQQGAYAVREVEEAVWKIQPGEVTDVISIGPDSFYIARLENRKLGRVQPFEDETIQERIRTTLKNPQKEATLRQLKKDLINNAVIQPDPPLYEPVLQMALQKYPEWAAGKP